MTCYHNQRDEWSWRQTCLFCKNVICDLCYIPHTRAEHPDRLSCTKPDDVAVEPEKA